MTAVNDNVQNQPGIANRFCTETNTGTGIRTQSPLFFIGSSPSMAERIINPDHPAAGVMVSINALGKRQSNFEVKDWILDSGAFTEVARHGGYRHGVEQYYWQICRWSRCGNLLIAVAQDWMCESFALARTGLTVEKHQQLTTERYDQLIKLNSPVPIMPVLQGYRVSEYLAHLYMYGERLTIGAWVGVGSVCRRNGKPDDEVLDILATIKQVRPDLRLHGFGLKQLALENQAVRSLLYSCDSMAWSVPRKFGNTTPELELAHQYQQKVNAAVTDSVQKRTPRTAGAGNGQGRKPKWKSKTTAIRIPEKYAERLIELAKQWESDPNDLTAEQINQRECHHWYKKAMELQCRLEKLEGHS